MAHTADRSYLSANASGQVPRTALIQKIKTQCAGKHIFIAAPGGYGKTVAASQWLATVRGNKAQLILGSEDNVPGFFYKRLAAALYNLTGKVNPVPDVAISFDRLLEIIKKLPSKGKRCYLVMDDAHMIRNEEIIMRMPVLFDRIPGYIRCCMISRLEPTRLFIKAKRFEVINKNDLAFSTEEIEWLGAEKGVELSRSQAEDLHKKTGGWVMYLLALLSGGTMPGEIAAVETPLALTQYIESQIWEPTGQVSKILLLSLAVADTITPELCERLTLEKDGARLLRQLSASENAFLSPAGTGKDTYHFHDIYREFLMGRLEDYLSQNEIRRLNDVVGRWHYKRGEYYEGAKHYILNRDHDGITRCLSEALRYLKETAQMSVEVRLNQARQYLKDLPDDFITENVYLIIWRASAAFHDGDTETFTRYMDILYERFPEIAEKHPDLIQTLMFVYCLDYRISMRDQFKSIAEKVPPRSNENPAQTSVTRISSITQNLPYFHRSMRDHSEFFELNPEDMKLAASTYGIAIGKDYETMEPSVMAGLHYERGEMIEALRFALAGYSACTEDMHPETRFCSHMILAAIFHAIGALQEAGILMDKMAEYIENDARFLMLNFKALSTIWALHTGDKTAAREWLDVNAYRSPGRLPFYQICRHFATLHSYIALEDNAGAISFGKRLKELADNYRRPLDRLETRLLTAIALRRSGDNAASADYFRQAVEIAMPFRFTQSFVVEGREVLPMLRELSKGKDISGSLMQFSSVLSDAICARHTLKSDKISAPMLSKRQRMMLSHLDSGLSYAEIAAKTGIPRATVKYHLLTAYKKIGVHDGAEAITRAKELGIL